MPDVENFKARLLNAGILDPEGVVHHEFKNGEHGRKLDFDKVAKGSDLYREWLGLNVISILKRHGVLPSSVVFGVADGMTGFGFEVGKKLGDNTLGLRTEKVRGKVRLTKIAELVIRSMQPKLAIIVDDVGTTGSTAAPIAREIYEVGVENIEVQYTWQRRKTLPYLDEAKVAYYSIIRQVLPTLSPQDCEAYGDCSRGVKLIRHG